MMFHWLIAALILIDFGFALSFSQFNPGDALYFAFAYRMHMSTGMLVLALSVSCLVWRLLHKYPPLPRNMHVATRVLAKTAHTLLYLFIIVVPVTGWAILSARRKPAPLFRGLDWPNIAFLAHMTREQRIYYHDLFLPAHTKLSYLGMSLVGLHICAALYHHFSRRDDVLMRMLPRMRSR
jgi:cytochrome b561